jgi:hypothetical protein
LALHVGAWLKRQWWISLISGDRSLCNEPLVIGLAGGRHSAAGGDKSGAARLAQALSQSCPHARILLLPPAPQEHDLRDIHVLIVLDPNVNLRAARHRRADLVVLAWVARAPDVKRWERAIEAGVAEAFDACLSRSPAAQQAAPDAGFPTCRSTPDEPLGREVSGPLFVPAPAVESYAGVLNALADTPERAANLRAASELIKPPFVAGNCSSSPLA